jgi:HD-GYP domain-containing protein (c-di-GMP phosphodiesterase class II)
MALAIITRGAQAGRRLTIVQWPATIGRDAGSVIPIDDNRVSRYHARIKKRDRLYILEDLQSRNGTWLNGDKVSNSVINSGDKILIGDTEIVFLTPEAQIDLATELLELEHVSTGNDFEEIGGPLDVAQEGGNDALPQARRLNVDLDLSFQSLSPKLLATIFEAHSNILSADGLKECCATVLKGIHAINSEISRSVIFLWSRASRKLLPMATRHTGKTSKFIFPKRAIESVISRKQGIILSPAISGTTQIARHRAILPIIHHGELLCLVHFEIDNIPAGMPPDLVDAIRFLLERAAPSIDSFSLRQDLDSYSVGMIEAMIATLEAKDTYTHGHSERVSRYCMAIAEEMNLDRDVKKLLLMSALCHDIGKIGIPDAILRKAALLNPDEYEEMKQHPVIGANICW